MRKITTPSSHDADFKAALPALERAAARARETAIMFNTPLVYWKNGKVVLTWPKAEGRKRGKR